MYMLLTISVLIFIILDVYILLLIIFYYSNTCLERSKNYYSKKYKKIIKMDLYKVHYLYKINYNCFRS